MSDLTNYYAEEFLGHGFDGTDMPASHGSVWIAAHTGDPGNNATQNEVSTSDYSRVEVAVSSFDATARTRTNNTAIEFAQATNDWGTITYLSVWDGSADTDNGLWYDALSSSVTINANDTLRIDAGDLTATL